MTDDQFKALMSDVQIVVITAGLLFAILRATRLSQRTMSEQIYSLTLREGEGIKAKRYFPPTT
jgi:hypothetical protein